MKYRVWFPDWGETEADAREWIDRTWMTAAINAVRGVERHRRDFPVARGEDDMLVCVSNGTETMAYMVSGEMIPDYRAVAFDMEKGEMKFEG